MIPTNYLRFIPRMCVKQLQQWWTQPYEDWKLAHVANPYDGICDGEWRDVPNWTGGTEA